MYVHHIAMGIARNGFQSRTFGVGHDLPVLIRDTAASPTEVASEHMLHATYLLVLVLLCALAGSSESLLFGYRLLSVLYLLLTAHYSVPTSHFALLTTHYSLLITYSLLTPHSSLLTTHDSLFATHYSLLTALTTHFSLPTTHHSPTTKYQTLNTKHLLNSKHEAPNTSHLPTAVPTGRGPIPIKVGHPTG